MCNITTNNIIGKTAHELFINKIAKQEVATDKIVMKSKTVMVYEETVTLQNGLTKKLLVTKAPYLHSDGIVDGIIGIVSDITGLREAEERYKLFAEHSNDGIAILSNGVHIYANKRFAELFGYDDINDIIGKGHDIVIYGKDVERVRRYSLLRKHGKQAETHYIARGVKKNGDLIYVDISVAAISYRGIPSSLAFMRDVTDRVITMKELQKAEERYRTVFENTGAGTIIVEDDTIISLANSKFLQMAGYSSKTDIEGIKSWKEFFDASVISFMETYHVARRNKEHAHKIPTQYTTVFVDRYGKRKNVLMTVGVIPDTTKAVASIVVLPDQINTPLL
jgi:PAS domain S-box-containing protein